MLLIYILAVQVIAFTYEHRISSTLKLDSPKKEVRIQRIPGRGCSLTPVNASNFVKVELSNVEMREGVGGEHYPGEWHNISYNYRINITVTEPAGYSRINWPVDVYVKFNPCANRQGIRLVNKTGGIVVFQIWNSTGNQTHMMSATITFLATVGAGSSAEYYIYYDTKPVGRPVFPTQVMLSVSTDPSTGQPIYTIAGQSYSKAVLAPGRQIGARYVWTGGRILEITEASTSLNLYTSPMNDIGISRNPSLANPFGDANATSQPESRFIDTETQNGPIFILYKVINAPIYDTSGSTIAKANFTYRFLAFGWLVEAYVKWTANDVPNANYWIGAYIFDQDDAADVVYDRVATPASTVILGEGLPWTKSAKNPDWGREDLTNNLRAFITPVLTKNTQYRVRLTWSGYVDLDVFVYSERGFLIEGYDSLWDKLDGFVVSQDYTEEEVCVATENERWIIVVLAYCSEGASASFTVTVTNTGTGQTIATFTGSFTSEQFIYTSRYSAYCNYNYYPTYPRTIDTSREGNVGYSVGGWAKRYFADNELVAFILPMPRTGGDDYDIRIWWNLEYAKVHYHIYLPDGTEWIRDTSGAPPPLTRNIIPQTGGYYAILVHYYDGSYYDPDDGSSNDDITVELYFEPPFAETEDYEGNGNWNWIALYHGTFNRAVGFVNISLEVNVGSFQYRDLYWGNKGEGPSTDEDYILWAIRILGMSASSGDWIRAKYAVIFAAESGSSTIEYMALRLRAPLLISIAQTERFTLQVTYNVADGDNGPVVNAQVTLVNKTSEAIVSAGYTDWSGKVTFDVPRYDNYTLNITLSSANNIHSIVEDLDLSTIPYTTFSISSFYQFPHLVRVIIQCNDTEGRILQGALVRFNETIAYASTNLTGHLDVYIPRGIWNITVSYKFDFDSYNLTYTNKTPVKDIYGNNITMVRWALINVTQGQTWILIDLDATAPPPLRIELREGSYSYSLYWGGNIYTKVAIISEVNLVDAADNVTWKIVYAKNGTIVPGFGTLKMCKVSLGTYSINISTYGLPAGEMYYLVIDVNTTTVGGREYFIDAYGNKYQRPQPLLIAVMVQPRPTKIVVAALTSTIYWDEEFCVRLYFQDALNDSYLPDASVRILFSGPTSFEGMLVQQDNEYIFALSSFKYPTGAYMITITASKGNYSKSEYFITLVVNPRPTELFSQTYVETPWQMENYNLSIYYNDSRRRVLVSNAVTRFEIINPITQELLAEGSLVETDSKYMFSIPVHQLGVGEFTARIYFSKEYYEGRFLSIMIKINPRKTFATANATSIELIWGDTSYILLSYYDSETSPPQKIIGAIASYMVLPFGQDTPVRTGELEPYGSDYLLKLNFTHNMSTGNYRIIVTLFKENYKTQRLEISLTISSVPTYLIVPQKDIALEYGEYLNMSISYFCYKGGEVQAITDANATYIIYYGENVLYRGTLVFDSKVGSYVLKIDTVQILEMLSGVLGTDIQLPISIKIELYFLKQYHQEQKEIITLIIDKFSVEITVAKEPPQEITRIQFIDEHKITEIDVFVYHGNLPVDDAVVIANVSSIEAEMFRIYSATRIGAGVFRIVVDWGVFPPGYKWEVVIFVKSVKMYGREIPADKFVYDILKYVVAVDYLSGSTRIHIPGIGYIYIANMFLYPMLTILLVMFAYGSYKLISWWSLPWQVREVIKILKLIEKGIFKYKAPDRKEYIVELIRKELALKT